MVSGLYTKYFESPCIFFKDIVDMYLAESSSVKARFFDMGKAFEQEGHILFAD